MKNLRFSRRNLLKGAGLGAATQLLLPELLNPAYAAEAVPKMFVMFYSYHGTWKSEWGSGGNGSMTLGPLLQPLAPFKDDIVLVSGLEMRSAFLHTGNPNAGHIQGQVHSLTSIRPLTPVADEGSKPIAGGPSIDQEILSLLKEKNGGKSLTDIDSFAVRISNDSPGPDQMMGRAGYRRSSKTGAIQIVAPNDNPDSVWSNLFGQKLSDPTTALQRRLMAQFAKGQFQSTSQKVKDLYGRSSQERFIAHAEYMSSLEQSLARMPANGGSGGAAVSAAVSEQGCKVPERATIPEKPVHLFGDYLSENMPKLVQLGLACGRSRFATVCIEANIDPDTGLHNWMHDGNIPATRPYHIKVAEQVAKTLKLLKETPTADGKNLLYHTVFLWAGELSDGKNHLFNDLNWIVGGQAGGALQTGRFVDAKGRSNADLFVSLGKLMDSGMTTFGDPAAFDRPLEAIKA